MHPLLLLPHVSVREQTREGTETERARRAPEAHYVRATYFAAMLCCVACCRWVVGLYDPLRNFICCCCVRLFAVRPALYVCCVNYFCYLFPLCCAMCLCVACCRRWCYPIWAATRTTFVCCCWCLVCRLSFLCVSEVYCSIHNIFLVLPSSVGCWMRGPENQRGDALSGYPGVFTHWMLACGFL